MGDVELAVVPGTAHAGFARGVLDTWIDHEVPRAERLAAGRSPVGRGGCRGSAASAPPPPVPSSVGLGLGLVAGSGVAVPALSRTR